MRSFIVAAVVVWALAQPVQAGDPLQNFVNNYQRGGYGSGAGDLVPKTPASPTPAPADPPMQFVQELTRDPGDVPSDGSIRANPGDDSYTITRPFDPERDAPPGPMAPGGLQGPVNGGLPGAPPPVCPGH